MSSFSELPADTLVIISSYWGYGSGTLLRVSKETREKLLNREFPFPIFIYRTSDKPWFPKEESVIASSLRSHLYKATIKYSQLAMSLRANWRMLRKCLLMYSDPVYTPLQLWNIPMDRHKVICEVIDERTRIKHWIEFKTYRLLRLYFRMLAQYLPVSPSQELQQRAVRHLRTREIDYLIDRTDQPFGRMLYDEYERRHSQE